MLALLIAGGSNISSEILAREVKDINFVICADGGVNNAHELGINPDVIIGDLDSADSSLLELYANMNVKLIKYSPEKDYTDTELAIEYVIANGYDEIVMAGVTGTRLDHTLANIFLTERYLKKGIRIKIIDNNNTICAVTDNLIVQNIKNSYVSLISATDTIDSLTLDGFKYPLNKVNVERGSTLCVSNEVVGEQGIITIENGCAIVFISRD